MTEIIEPDEFDRLEAAMQGGPPMQCEVVHHFPDGFYVRECRFKAGTLGTSMIHNTTHAFVITRGKVKVVSKKEGAVIYEGPHFGFTVPGTRRMLLALEDTVWLTFHANPDNGRDIEAIAARILAPHVNPLLPAGATEEWRKSLPTPTPAIP